MLAIASGAFAEAQTKLPTSDRMSAATSALPASKASVTKVAPQAGGVLKDRIRQCGADREKYKQVALQINGMNCDRFGGEKYKELLKSRDGYCRSMPMSADVKADYKMMDDSLAKFGERCVCRKLLDSIEANTKTMSWIRAEGCYTKDATYDQALKNLGLIDAEWQQGCKDIVSSVSQNKYVDGKNEFMNLKGKVEKSCWEARGCAKAMDNYKTTMLELEKIKANRCQGKIHETLTAAHSMRGTAISACSNFMSQVAAQINKNDKQRSDAIQYCSSRSITMDVRCPFTSEVDIQSSKKAGSFSKTTHVNVKEHWCKHEADMPWCEQYGDVKINASKEYYVVGGSKENDLAMRICVSPSKWGKCHAVSSSTGQCLDSK